MYYQIHHMILEASLMKPDHIRPKSWITNISWCSRFPTHLSSLCFLTFFSSSENPRAQSSGSFFCSRHELFRRPDAGRVSLLLPGNAGLLQQWNRTDRYHFPTTQQREPSFSGWLEDKGIRYTSKKSKYDFFLFSIFRSITSDINKGTYAPINL